MKSNGETMPTRRPCRRLGAQEFSSPAPLLSPGLSGSVSNLLPEK